MSENTVTYYTGPQRSAAKPARKRKAGPPASVPYGPGYYRTAPNGKGFDCVICHRYKQIRARRPDEPSARAWIDAQESALKLGREPLTRAEMLDAQDALAELPAGATLLQAVRAFAAAVAVPQSLPLGRASAAFLEQRAEVAKPVTLRKYRHALKQLATAAGADRLVSGLSVEDVERIIAGRSGRTRNNYIRHLSTFFRWAVDRQYIREDPTAKILRSRPAEPPKGVLTVDQCRALLAAAAVKKPAMVPFLAVSLFTGIRPGEMEKLRAGNIGAQYVRLDGSITKTADARNVAVRPVLSAWLKVCPLREGRIAPYSTKHLYGAIRKVRYWTQRLAKETGVKAYAVDVWPDDCTRHSYATYIYELEKDAAATAADLGHVGTDVFFRHYRALAHPGDGKKFVGITPESLSKLTVILQRLSEPVAPQRVQSPS